MSRIIVDAIRNSSASSDNINLDSSGKVGIGTSSPTYPISIVKAGSGDAATLGIQNTGSHPAGIHLLSGHGNWSIFNSSTVANNFEIKDDSLSVFLINTDHDIQLSDGTTVRNQITSDHSDAADAQNRRGFHMTDGPAVVHSDGGDGRGFEVWTSHAGQAGSNRAKLNFRVEGDGDARNTNNSYGSLSDEKLKQDIVDASSQWEDIKAVKVKKFRFKDLVANLGDDKAPTHIGVVAQDLETSGMSGLVKETPDIINNVDQGTVTKSVKYSVLYMKAIKALQEAMTRIETLETKVAALESG